ncbi:MAG: hypothetical protein J7641_05230 [Cyanobacteria bacterium SID2]|nr:hypothetical protein [Cyanobacteria bacterium SID2]MBP0006267.1 hypothetical protein [Cyanobacteria bacterium SBC]
MTTSFLPSLPALSDLFYRVWQAGTLTQNDRYQLQTFLLSEHLTESDYVLIDRLLHAVRRGWVVWTTDASRS